MRKDFSTNVGPITGNWMEKKKLSAPTSITYKINLKYKNQNF